ncbi:MAG: Bax inhibitor-1/YccA family protein [Oscillibacter sp.]|jgi:FtsH-binding integral membrane protein|nr:Bax inhibitor-1/YccA family protein [Oscillibacter sp.]
MRLNGYNYDEFSGYARESIAAYTAKTFLWMFLGLMTTFAVALFGYATGTIVYIFAIPYFHIILLAAELVVVLVLSARLQKLNVATARVLFFAYAVLNGIVFSVYFLIFTMLSLILVFAMTAVYFGGMAAYGYCTKTDLSRLRPILIGGLIFLIVFGLLSLFLPMGMMDRVVCLIGVGIFLAFTAYDTQKIRAYYQAYQGDQAMLERASIFSALQLYLDFVNLFLYLLRLLGRSRK